MARRQISRKAGLVVETLEGRALLSGLAHANVMRHRAAIVGKLRAGSIQTDPAGVSGIMNALRGGLGSEWVALIRSRVRNVTSIINGFVSGRYSAYSIPGLTVKTPNVQPGFTGQFYDQLAPAAVGAAVFKSNVLELSAIMRGPFRDPNTTYYVFALNRGAGGMLPPRFASLPGITPDALVTLTVGPYGSSASGVTTDLTSGTTQEISPGSIQIKGPIIRVFLNVNQFPSKGLPIQKYRFAFWTQTQPGSDLSTVVSFAPDASMNQIGVLKRVVAKR
jgi:hypothetical protein